MRGLGEKVDNDSGNEKNNDHEDIGGYKGI